GLYLLRDFQFMSGASLGFQLGSNGPPALFDGPADFIQAYQCKGIMVQVLKAGKYAAPHGGLISKKQRLLSDPGGRLLHVFNAPQPWRVMKTNSAFSPFSIF